MRILKIILIILTLTVTYASMGQSFIIQEKDTAYVNSRSEYYYQRSLELALAAGFKDFAARAFFDIGYVRYKNNDYESAERFFEDAYRIFAQTGQLRGMYDARNASDLNYRRLGDFDQSDSCYRECLRIASDFKDSLMMADVKLNLISV